MWFPYYYGHRLYLHPISRGWRVMASVGVHGSKINLEKPSLRCCWRRSRYRGTTRPCYADVAQHLRRPSFNMVASFPNSLGLQMHRLLMHSLCWPSLGIALNVCSVMTLRVSPI